MASFLVTPVGQRRFRAEVSTIVVGMVAVQALVLLAFGWFGGVRLMHSVGQAAHEEEHLRLETEIRVFLESARGAVGALAAAPQHSAEDKGDDRNAELIWALMSESKALDNLSFIDHDGNVVGVQRHPEPGLRRIHLSDGHHEELFEVRSGIEKFELPPTGRFTTTDTRRSDAQNLTLKPWFARALQERLPIWTEIYPLMYSREQGLSFVVPDVTEDLKGALDGLAIGDVSLRHFAKLVASFSHAGAGESAILGPDGAVLVRSDGRPTEGRPDILAVVLPAVAATPRGAPPIDFAGERWFVHAGQVPGTPFRLVSWLPEEVVVGDLRRALWMAAGVLGSSLLAAIAMSLWLSRRVTRPVEVLAGTARRIGRLDLDNLPQVDSPVEEIHRLGIALDESARSLQALRKFVPAGVVETLVREGRTLDPGGELTELTVMFTDIEGFTGIATTVPASVLVPQLTEYFNATAAVIVAHGGTIDKYLGDGILVLWGAPAKLPDAPLQACRAALALREAVANLNQDWRRRGLPAFETRIGIHTGPAVVGVLGSSERLTFTAFGDTVNVASRIEAYNKEVGTKVLVSGHTAAALNGYMVLRPMGEAALRGREGKLAVFELLNEATAEQRD